MVIRLVVTNLVMRLVVTWLLVVTRLLVVTGGY